MPGHLTEQVESDIRRVSHININTGVQSVCAERRREVSLLSLLKEVAFNQATAPCSCCSVSSPNCESHSAINHMITALE